MSALEIVRPDLVTTADEQRVAAREAHEAVRLAAEDFIRCAKAIHRGGEVQAWLQDDEYEADCERGWDETQFWSRFSSWAAWLWERETGNAIAQARAYQIDDAGELLEILAYTNGISLPQNERQLRPLRKMLRATRRGQLLDRSERDEAIREIWQTAVEHEPTPAKAAARIGTYAKRYGGPFERAYSTTKVEKELRRQERIKRLSAVVVDKLKDLIAEDYQSAVIVAQQVAELMQREEEARYG